MKLIFAQYVDDVNPNQYLFVLGKNSNPIYMFKSKESDRLKDPTGNYRAVFEQDVEINDIVQTTVFIKGNDVTILQCRRFISDASTIELAWKKVEAVGTVLPSFASYNFLIQLNTPPFFFWDLIKS